jgi:hypothetical protein
MKKELVSLFFSMTHEVDHLLEVFNKKQLLDFYINGCELRIRMEGQLENFERFNKETGVEFGALISNRFHLAKQLNVLKNALEKLGVKGIEENQHNIFNN